MITFRGRCSRDSTPRSRHRGSCVRSCFADVAWGQYVVRTMGNITNPDPVQEEGEMIEAGWYADPSDPTRGRYWDGSSFTEVRTGLVTPFPEYPEVLVDGPAAVVPAPGLVGSDLPTQAVPVVHDESAVVSSVVPVRPDDGRRGIAAAAIAAAILLVAGLLIWLATRSSDLAKPHDCGSGIAINDWNNSGVTFNNGTKGNWPDGVAPGTKAGLDATCAGVLALRNATATTIAPVSTSVLTLTTTTPSAPVAPTTRPAVIPATTAAPRVPSTMAATPPTVKPGTAAVLGDGLTFVVVNYAPDGSSMLVAPSGTVPPPTSGRQYAVVSVRVTNPTNAPIDPAGLDLKLSNSSGSGLYASSNTVATDKPLQLNGPIAGGASQSGDLVFEVPRAEAGSLVLRAATPSGSTLFGLG